MGHFRSLGSLLFQLGVDNWISGYLSSRGYPEFYEKTFQKSKNISTWSCDFLQGSYVEKKFSMECNTDRSTLKRLYEDAEKRVLKPFSEMVHVYPTEQAQQITLELLSAGFNYTVETFENEQEIIRCYHDAKHNNT